MCGGGSALVLSPPGSPVTPNFLQGEELVNTLDTSKGCPLEQSWSPAPTLTCVVNDRDWSGRTFHIPDCPPKQAIGTLKSWYIRNVCPTARPSSIVVLGDSGLKLHDELPFWQVAQGEGMFRVSVVHVPISNEPLIEHASFECITVYVQHESNGILTAIAMPNNSTLLQLKITAFEKLGLGDAEAALEPAVKFSHRGSVLDNEATMHAAHLQDGDRISIGEHQTPPNSYRTPRTPSPCLEEEQYHNIADIWAHKPKPPNAPCPTTRRHRNSDTRRNRELEKIKRSYRTKMCRSRGYCKFGGGCWFAHNPGELRRPSDPLPANCPGVNKLEKYAKRQEHP
eukprot:TRINITY_DN5187_c0_g1_i1.p1 TRINITY_DN5187_c0_g1~~TRINITY_DN5187_c0_g1_i1.p1  ORF type:complete len:339 (-),score=35.61 TRINITY_DN5187_c0_g1_i1:358-1374(-)